MASTGTPTVTVPQLQQIYPKMMAKQAKIAKAAQKSQNPRPTAAKRLSGFISSKRQKRTRKRNKQQDDQDAQDAQNQPGDHNGRSVFDETSDEEDLDQLYKDRMRLWACGYNSMHQLKSSPDNSDHSICCPPKDIYRFQRVLTAKKIENVRAGLFWAEVTYKAEDKEEPIRMRMGVAGEILKDEENEKNAKAENERTVTVRGSHIQETSLGKGRKLTVDMKIKNGHCLQLVAGSCSFAALFQFPGVNGRKTTKVFTWGDERFPLCLGRILRTGQNVRKSDQTFASCPTEIEMFSQLSNDDNIQSVSANSGLAFAALTEKGKAFVWGYGPGLSAGVMPINLDNQDIMSIAVGETHMVALTRDQKIWTWGSGADGQLGRGAVSVVENWESVRLTNFPQTQEIKKVWAGKRSSFFTTGTADYTTEAKATSGEQNDPSGDSQDDNNGKGKENATNTNQEGPHTKRSRSTFRHSISGILKGRGN